MNRHGLRGDQFARIEKLLPGRPGHVGRDSEFGNRLFVEAVIWKFRTGVPWRDMPARFGAWKNIHTRFSRWAVKGIWESIFKAVADDPDTEYAMIDATIVRAHQHSAGARKKPIVNQAIGRSRGGLTTKIHMVVDALGNPLAFSLTGGQVHDITQAETLTAKIQAEALLADKGYNSDKYVASLEVRAIKPVIPPKANRKVKRDCDFALYAERNLVEQILPIHQTIPRYSHPLRKDRPQFPRSIATRLRAGLAQMRTRPSLRASPRYGRALTRF